MMSVSNLSRVSCLSACLLLIAVSSGCPVTLAPRVTRFSLDDNAGSTRVHTVQLSSVCTAFPTEYMASEAPSFDGETWSSYLPDLTFEISPELGIHTVYFKVRNAVGESEVVSADITLVPPASITDLMTLGGPMSVATDINDLGHVVGASDTASLAYHAFEWDCEGGMREVGTLGTLSYAAGINDLNQIAGISYTEEGLTHAFLKNEGEEIRDLGAFWGDYSFAADINEGGEVIGNGSVPSGEIHVILWDSENGYQDLGSLGGDGFDGAEAINNVRQVAANSSYSSDEMRAYLLDPTSGPLELGSLGGLMTMAVGINNSGQVVGFGTTTEGAEHAFLWDSIDGMRDLGAPYGSWNYSRAYDINDSGQVVGSAYFSTGIFSRPHAFVWDEAHGMRDLGTLGGDESHADAINNVGQIVGASQTASGDWHATLWTLVEDE